MSAWDPYDLSALPLSAYTPGQGDIKMEGKMETASGAPVYHLEDYLAGNAPYVTGATSKKNPSGQTVYRTVGDNVVPVKITDYGPGVKGIDIASSNSAWAKNFPHQGSRDTTLLTGPQINTPASTPSVPSPTSGGAYVSSTPAVRPGLSPMTDPVATTSPYTSLGNSLAQTGQAYARQGEQAASQGMAQALQMLSQRKSAMSQYLPPIGGGYYG